MRKRTRNEKSGHAEWVRRVHRGMTSQHRLVAMFQSQTKAVSDVVVDVRGCSINFARAGK